MNRRYDKEKYLNLVEKIRTAIPDISLTTDIIVGFPGETEEDFLETVDVVKKVRYDSAFTFIYSKRTGTPAAVMENQIPEDVVKDREEDFLETVDVVKKVRYDSAFTFIYSKRTGTPAAVMENQIPEDVVKDRFNRLLETVQTIGREMSARDTGKVMEVLVEEQNSQDKHLMTGRLSKSGQTPDDRTSFQQSAGSF